MVSKVNMHYKIPSRHTSLSKRSLSGKGGFLRRNNFNMCSILEHAFVADKAELSRVAESNEALSEGLVNNPNKTYNFQSSVGCFVILEI
jgi:hypothetical protein